MAPRARTVRLALGPGSVAVVIAGIALGWLAFGVLTAARRPLGWAVAALVVATIVEPVVSFLDRWLPRALAVVVVFLAIGGGAGGLTFGVLHELDEQVDRLREVAPEAAAGVEEGDGLVASIARDIDLEERVRRAVEELEKPSSGVAAGAAGSAGGFLIGAILSLFLLSWAPRLTQGALAQVRDPDRRAAVARVLAAALGRGRRYVLGNIALALLAGAVAAGAAALEDVPAPLALGLAVAAGSVVPGVGVVIGSLPAILLEAGLGTGDGALRLALGFLTLQLAHEVALRRFVISRSLVVGPAVVLIALVLGYEVYGVGGAYYGAALAVFAVAGLDVVGEARFRPAGPAEGAAAVADGPAVSGAPGLDR